MRMLLETIKSELIGDFQEPYGAITMSFTKFFLSINDYIAISNSYYVTDFSVNAKIGFLKACLRWTFKNMTQRL